MTSGRKIITLKKQEADMKKSERRIRRAVLITGTVLCMGLSAFPAAAAGRIQKISLYLEGEQAKPGQFLDDTLPEITTSGEKYTIHKYDYVNDRVKWDRRDTPEDDVRGVCIYLTFDAFSTPGASAKERKDAIEAKALEAEKKSKKKAKKIRSTEIAYGWYKDANGWWYMEEDGNWHSNEWKNTNGIWSYLDADGYAKTGWFTVDGIWYYAGADGTLFVNTVTPDGYHVNGDGAWV